MQSQIVTSYYLTFRKAEFHVSLNFGIKAKSDSYSLFVLLTRDAVIFVLLGPNLGKYFLSSPTSTKKHS